MCCTESSMLKGCIKSLKTKRASLGGAENVPSAHQVVRRYNISSPLKELKTKGNMSDVVRC